MRGRNPRDEHGLKLDLVEQLLSVGVVRPEFGTIGTVRDWFPTRERDLATRLVVDLTTNPDCPLEYVTAAEKAVWLVDADDTREFLDDLRENPAWFDD